MTNLLSTTAFHHAFLETRSHLTDWVDIDKLWLVFAEVEFLEQVFHTLLLVHQTSTRLGLAGEFVLQTLVESSRENERLSLDFLNLLGCFILVLVLFGFEVIFAFENVDDLFELLKMTLTEQSVGFINDEELNLLQPLENTMTTANDFPQTSRGTNDDVCVLKLSLLLSHRETSGQSYDPGCLFDTRA
jgi:hypothetical protein